MTLYAWRKQARAAGAVVPGDGKNPEGWSSREKFRVVLESAGLSETELAEYCRRKGLYVEQIREWRDACEQANATAQERSRAEREQSKAARMQIREPERERKRDKAALAVAAGARRDKACEELDVSLRTVQRWSHRVEDGRPGAVRVAPSNKLSDVEREQVLAIADQPEHASLAPHQIVPRLADQGVYVASESTF